MSRWIDGKEIGSAVVAYDAAGRPKTTALDVPAIPGVIEPEQSDVYTTATTYNDDGTIAAIDLGEAPQVPCRMLAGSREM